MIRSPSNRMTTSGTMIAMMIIVMLTSCQIWDVMIFDHTGGFLSMHHMRPDRGSCQATDETANLIIRIDEDALI